VGRTSYSGRRTCESCKSIDVRDWHRGGLLHPGRRFSWSWTRHGQPSGSISVRSEANAVTLAFRFRGSGGSEWKLVEQLDGCNFGGHRPWFLCSVCSGDRRCGRRDARISSSERMRSRVSRDRGL
jgi:hypothetical protein